MSISPYLNPTDFEHLYADRESWRSITIHFYRMLTGVDTGRITVLSCSGHAIDTLSLYGKGVTSIDLHHHFHMLSRPSWPPGWRQNNGYPCLSLPHGMELVSTKQGIVKTTDQSDWRRLPPAVAPSGALWLSVLPWNPTPPPSLPPTGELTSLERRILDMKIDPASAMLDHSRPCPKCNGSGNMSLGIMPFVPCDCGAKLS